MSPKENDMPALEPITYTHTEWEQEATRRFGDDPMKWRFECPVCGHVASTQDYKDNGAPSAAVAFSCIGRYLDPMAGPAMDGTDAPGPCDYAGGGLFRLNPVTVKGDDHESRVFAFDSVRDGDAYFDEHTFVPMAGFRPVERVTDPRDTAPTERAMNQHYVPSIDSTITLRPQHRDAIKSASTKLRVVDVAGAIVTVQGSGAATHEVQLPQIETPVGWKPVYEPIVSPENHERMQQWFANRGGIAVFVGIDLARSNLGIHTFSPGDRPQPQEYHLGLVEVVTDPTRILFHKDQAVKLPRMKAEREKALGRLDTAGVRYKAGRIDRYEWVADVPFEDLDKLPK